MGQLRVALEDLVAVILFDEVGGIPAVGFSGDGSTLDRALDAMGERFADDAFGGVGAPFPFHSRTGLEGVTRRAPLGRHTFW